MKITRSQLKRLIKEEIARAGISTTLMEGYRQYDVGERDAATLSSELDEIQVRFEQTIQSLANDIATETNRGVFSNSDEGLVMEALQQFDEAAQSYHNEISVLLPHTDRLLDAINSNQTDTVGGNLHELFGTQQSASKILAVMTGFRHVSVLIEKLDSMLAAQNYDTMLEIIRRHERIPDGSW